MRILVVDDHDLFREWLTDTLKENDQIEVVEAVTLSQARVAVDKYNAAFDLILLDQGLPDGEGIELLREICTDNEHVTVAMLSGWDDHELMRTSLARGARGFIPKSMPPAVIESAIQLVLAGGTFIPDNLLPYLHQNGNAAHLIADNNRLTQRQSEVLKLLREGLSNKEIGRSLGISEATVKAHVTMVLRAHGVTSRNELKNT